jgi:hypothetical protein
MFIISCAVRCWSLFYQGGLITLVIFQLLFPFLNFFPKATNAGEQNHKENRYGDKNYFQDNDSPFCEMIKAVIGIPCSND